LPLVDRDESVLVVVDAQPGFYAAASLSDSDRDAAAKALSRAVGVAGVAAALGVPALVTEEDPGRNGPTEARILEELGPDTQVFTKPSFGLAECPDILAAVRATQRGTVVLAGFETDVCVAQSAVGLVERGFRAVVLEDATFSPGAMHERGLARAAAGGAERNHCKGVAYEWLGTLDASRRLSAEHPQLGEWLAEGG
jgi:nicotinamidase-related amidase